LEEQIKLQNGHFIAILVIFAAKAAIVEKIGSERRSLDNARKIREMISK